MNSRARRVRRRSAGPSQLHRVRRRQQRRRGPLQILQCLLIQRVQLVPGVQRVQLVPGCRTSSATLFVLLQRNDPKRSAQTEVEITLPGQPLTGTMSQLTGPSYEAEDQTVIDGVASGPLPAAERPTVPGFEYGSREQSIKLTAGTLTVLNFSY